MTALTCDNRSEVARWWNTARPLTDQLDLTERLAMSNRICSIDGCDRPQLSRSWCRLHYYRWYRQGSPDAVRVPAAGCSVPDCDQPHQARGFCSKHYLRLQRTGTVVRVGNPKATNYRGDAVGYSGAHTRVRELRGLASQHQCSCGAPASEWAYDHTDPAEKTATRATGWGKGLTGPLAYSLDPDHYVPMCHPCHVSFDKRK